MPWGSGDRHREQENTGFQKILHNAADFPEGLVFSPKFLIKPNQATLLRHRTPSILFAAGIKLVVFASMDGLTKSISQHTFLVIFAPGWLAVKRVLAHLKQQKNQSSS